MRAIGENVSDRIERVRRSGKRAGLHVRRHCSNARCFERFSRLLIGRSVREKRVSLIIEVEDLRNKDGPLPTGQLQDSEHHALIRHHTGIPAIDFPEVIVAHLLDEARAEGLEVGGVPLFAPRIVPDRRREPQASVDGKLPVGDPGPLAMCVQDALQSMRGQLVVAIEPHDDLVVG